MLGYTVPVQVPDFPNCFKHGETIGIVAQPGGLKTSVTIASTRDSDDVVRIISRSLNRNRCKLLDITGKMTRTMDKIENCQVKFIEVRDTAGFIDGILKEFLPGEEFQMIYLYGLSPLWALAYNEFGIAYYASTIFLMLTYLSFVTRIYGRQLTILIEDWFQRKHRFMYEVVRYISDSFTTPP